jgi:small subunit ribosomal protein S13
MARILGVEIPNNKKIFVSLQSIYGIGEKTSYDILMH